MFNGVDRMENILKSCFVTVPVLQVDDQGEQVLVSNLAVGTSYHFPREILDILTFFRQPKPLSSWLQQPGASQAVLVRAVSYAFLTDIDRMVTLVEKTIGQAVKLSTFLDQDQAGTTAVFGVPVDIAATGLGGARHGPSEIRQYFRPSSFAKTDLTSSTAATDQSLYLDFETRRQYSGPVPSTVDLGNAIALPGEGIATYGPRVALLADMILERGGIPAMLGGDHSCTAFALEPHLKRNPKLGILHFDAHHDIWPPPAPQYSYVTHANALYGSLKSESVQVLLQLGLRIFDSAFEGQLQADPRLKYLSARELQKLPPEKAFEGLPRDIPYYLTFDIDCIDPIYAPETGTPVAGGLSYYQALDLVDYAARHFEIVGWDIVEVGQKQDTTNAAALCAGRIVRQLLLGHMPFELLTNYAR